MPEPTIEPKATTCPSCFNGGWVCESHPDRPGPCSVGKDDPRCCPCGDACVPCPLCNDPSTWVASTPHLPAGMTVDTARPGERGVNN